MSFCRRFRNLQKHQSLPEYASKNNKQNKSNKTVCCKKTFLHIRIKASYTLEMAIVLPLVVAFLTTILFFFRVLQVQTQVQEALTYASRHTAAQAALSDNTATLLGSAEMYFRKEIRQYAEYQKYVADQSGGVSLLLSDLKGPEITLRADYFVKLPIMFFKVKGVRITQYSTSRKWTGDHAEWLEADYVYVTEHGTVYHCSRNCSYLDLSIREADYAGISQLRNKNEHKYNGCSQCVAKNKTFKRVYITDYGSCYHTELACSGLKRTVYLILKSDAGNKGPCSKCARGQMGDEEE